MGTNLHQDAMTFVTLVTHILQDFTKIREVCTKEELTARAAVTGAMTVTVALAAAVAVAATVAVTAHAMIVSTAAPAWVAVLRPRLRKMPQVSDSLQMSVTAKK